VIDRRNFILAVLGTALVPGAVAEVKPTGNKLAWAEYCDEMLQLASAYQERKVNHQDMLARGVQLLQQLDMSDAAFQTAVQNSWESGNRYWLWRRLIRDTGITGGILVIDRDQPVPMHDHPGATGMLRVLKGKVEVWQYDCSGPDATNGDAILELASHRILRPGDVAFLTPERGNIHTLRAQSRTCHLLDYFIPPYQRSKRTWYLPVDDGWHDRDQVICRSVQEDDFYMS